MKMITGLNETDIESIIEDGFIPIRDEFGKLLCRYNPKQNTIEIQRRGIKTTIDLNQYQRSATPVYNGPMAFCNDVSLKDIQADQELRYRLEEAVNHQWKFIDYHGKRIELSYLSATSAAQTGGDLWQTP